MYVQEAKRPKVQHRQFYFHAETIRYYHMSEPDRRYIEADAPSQRAGAPWPEVSHATYFSEFKSNHSAQGLQVRLKSGIDSQSGHYNFNGQSRRKSMGYEFMSLST